MEKTTSQPMTVAILDREYQFACASEERDALREAAALLDERMREIRASVASMAVERIAVMAALNLSDELLKLQKNEAHRQVSVDNRIRMLADELDDALSG
jgi:cell division protein ZapA